MYRMRDILGAPNLSRGCRHNSRRTYRAVGGELQVIVKRGDQVTEVQMAARPQSSQRAGTISVTKLSARRQRQLYETADVWPGRRG